MEVELANGDNRSRFDFEVAAKVFSGGFFGAGLAEAGADFRVWLSDRAETPGLAITGVLEADLGRDGGQGTF